jgi:hypothetical protein
VLPKRSAPRIVLPASAIPGWPADVVLPFDPVWRRDYAGSVQRLVRDGVDTPLRMDARAFRRFSHDSARQRRPWLRHRLSTNCRNAQEDRSD